MRNRYFLTAAFLIVVVFGRQSAEAQITINIPSVPKIPKVKKPKVETTTPTESTTTTPTTPTTTSNDQGGTTAGNKQEEPYEDMDGRIALFLDEIKKAQKEMDQYTPEDSLYLVGGNSTEWLWRAVSQKERGEFMEKWKSVMGPGAKKRFDDGFAALGASAAKKLPTYRSGIAKYSVRNAAEEKLMKGVLTKIADYKIFSVGLQQANWLIDKNDYGLPTARYKHGVVYLRDTKSDHPYCYATYINIKQDYAGGGTYGASYARFIEDEMVGCPAEK